MDYPYAVEHKPFNEYFASVDQLDANLIQCLLLDGYRDSYLDYQQEEKMLGIPDTDGQIVAMALRIHLLPCNGLTTLFTQGKETPIIWERDDRDSFFES